MNIVFTNLAIDDLSRLREFIGTKNPRAADRKMTRLVKTINLLEQQPYLGKAVHVPDRMDNIRELIAGDYIVRYVLEEEALSILRIWHHLEDR